MRHFMGEHSGVNIVNIEVDGIILVNVPGAIAFVSLVYVPEGFLEILFITVKLDE